MTFFTSLVIFSIVVLHQADFELNTLLTDDTSHAGDAKAPVTGALPSNQKQQHQAPRTVSNTRRVTTSATVKDLKGPGVFQTKGHDKITDPVHAIPHPNANTVVKASQEKDKVGSVLTDQSLKQKAPDHTHDDVSTPVSDGDRRVSTNVDNGDDMKNGNVEESLKKGNVLKFPRASEVKPIDGRGKPDTVLSDAKQLHKEQKIVANDHQEKAEGLQKEKTVLEVQQEQKLILVEEVGEQRTAAQEKQLDMKTIPKIQTIEQESTANQEDNQEQQLSKESSTDDRMVDISSTDDLDGTNGPNHPNTSVDPATPDASIQSLQPVQGASDSPTLHPEATTTTTTMDAAQTQESSGKPQEETSEDKSLIIDESVEPPVTLLNATTSETSSNKSLTPPSVTSDEEMKSSKGPDVLPGSVQPPSRTSELSPDAVPSTAFIPGEVKSENDSERISVSELEVPSEMPSFDEWKQKEKEKSKHLEAEQTGQSAGPPAKVKGSKKRINYASVTCGAKVVGANQEAQNPSFMLIENKDQYMINPCKVKKVFTVELCESIQVQAIDIGNLELFSSLPQSFDVHVSDRFPCKEWKALGRFHARDERNIQTFQVEDSLIFAKYIKIDMLSHYGEEHYCPLSILRVFGTTVDEDDDIDDSESDNPDLLDEENVAEGFSTDNPTNLFASATDTVLSLVKTVLNPSIDATQRDDSTGSLASGDGVLSVNASGDGQKTMEPCTPEVTSGDTTVVEDGENVVEGEREPFQPSVPDALVKASDEHQGGEENVSDDDKSSLNKQFTITLIETPRTSLQEILDRCQFCDDGKNDSCLFDCDTTCGYYRLLSFVDPQSCITAWRNLRPPEPNLEEVESGITGQLNMTWVPEHGVAESKLKEGTDGSTETVVLETIETPLFDKEETVETEKATTSATVESTTAASEKGVQKNHTERTDVGADLSQQSVTNNSGTDQEQAVVPPPAGSIPESASKEYHTADVISGSCAETVSQEGEAAIDTSGHHEATVQFHGQENQVGQDQSQMTNGQHVVRSPSHEQPQIAQSQNKAPAQKPTNQTNGKPLNEKDDLSTGQGSNLRVIYAENPSKVEVTKDYELDGVPMDEITYQKLSSRGKESAFIKLKNRIKLLEVNLNLTNRYLEELSQRYKRQMEDMHSSLNKTITKLTNMAKTAEERDVQQQDHIASLETTVENLTIVVTSVERSIESMQRQLIERHLCLMFLEVLIFSGIVVFCLNRRSIQEVESHHHPRTLHPQLSVPAPSLPPQSDRSAILRRKSADSQPSRDQSVGLWNHQNEGNNSRDAVEEVKSHPPLPGTKPASVNAVLSSAGANDFSKRRKKKKLSYIRSLSPSTDMPQKFNSLPNHSPATGLIFGTSCKDTLRPDPAERDRLQSHCKRLSWDSSAYKPWKWNIFGSSQHNRSSSSSSVLSPISCGTNLKLGRSEEVRETNLSNEILEHRKNGLTKTSGLAENRQNEIFIMSAIDTHYKLNMKKMVSRGRPVAE